MFIRMADDACFDDQGPDIHNAKAAQDAWQRTIQFFAKTLCDEALQ